MAMNVQFDEVFEHVMMNAVIAACEGNGVLDGLAVSERGAGANMSVDVAAGSAWIDGTKYTESSTVNLTISAADATYDRKDLVTYDSNTSNPIVTTGTAAATPEPPDIPSGNILLAIVDVAAGATQITSADITDGRAMLDTNVVLTDGSRAMTGALKFTGADEFNRRIYFDYDSMHYDYIDFDPTAEVMEFVLDSGDTLLLTKTEITACEDLLPSADNSRKLGDTTKRWANIYGVNANFDNHNLVASDIPNLSTDKLTSGILPVSRGGTGVADDSYDADKVDGYHAGNSSGQVAVSNGTVCTDLNADKVDGFDAGTDELNVYAIPAGGYYSVLYKGAATGIIELGPSTDGYQLTTHYTGGPPTWAAASDLIFSDTHCPKCGKRFETGDTLVLYVVGHNEVGDTLTIPMHKDCAEAPKKTVAIKRKVFEDRHVLDELTGETKIQRVGKTQKKTVTKHKLKEGYELDHRTGKAIKINEDGSKDETQHDLSIALETVEETIDEPVYEDVEYEI